MLETGAYGRGDCVQKGFRSVKSLVVPQCIYFPGCLGLLLLETWTIINSPSGRWGNIVVFVSKGSVVAEGIFVWSVKNESCSIKEPCLGAIEDLKVAGGFCFEFFGGGRRENRDIWPTLLFPFPPSSLSSNSNSTDGITIRFFAGRSTTSSDSLSLPYPAMLFIEVFFSN